VSCLHRRVGFLRLHGHEGRRTRQRLDLKEYPAKQMVSHWSFIMITPVLQVGIPGGSVHRATGPLGHFKKPWSPPGPNGRDVNKLPRRALSSIRSRQVGEQGWNPTYLGPRMSAMLLLTIHHSVQWTPDGIPPRACEHRTRGAETRALGSSIPIELF
jgi:hypothetical protein